MTRIILAVALLALATPALAVNKCEIDGKTVYQGSPCPAEAKVAPMDSGTMSGMGRPLDPAVKLQMQQRLERQKQEAAAHRRAANQRAAERQEQERLERQARRTGIVAEGMSERDATLRYGRPDRTNVTQSGGRTCKFLYWDDPYRRVMVCDGEVRSSYAGGVD